MNENKDSKTTEAVGATKGWQPIETIPGDGTVVLVYGPELVHEDFCPTGITQGMSNGKDLVGGVWTDVGDCWDLRSIKATHWQPLPVPPVADSSPVEARQQTDAPMPESIEADQQKTPKEAQTVPAAKVKELIDELDGIKNDIHCSDNAEAIKRINAIIEDLSNLLVQGGGGG
jgi:hypothetical protein